jgi:ribonuclease P protein component
MRREMRSTVGAAHATKLLRHATRGILKTMLKNKSEIDKLFKTGKSVSNGVVLAKVIDSSSGFVFAVSSKKFKRAVDRNRIKRLMREVVRLNMIKDKSVAFVFIGDSVPTYLEIEKSIKGIIERI